MARLERRAIQALAAALLIGAASLTVTPPAPADVAPEVRQALLVRDYGAARALLEPLAERGDADAWFELGRLYERGLGTDRDERRAFSCFERAGSLGHVEAAYLAGVMLEKGRGAAADPAAARAWYRRAAAGGHRLAERRVQSDTPAGSPPMEPFSVVESGDAEALRQLPASVSMDVVDAHGRRLLNVAVTAGDPALIAMLLARGADPAAPDAAGNAPLHVAARLGSVAAADRLVAAGAAVDSPDAAGNTALHLAVAAEHGELVDWLLAHGADSQRPNEAGWTPRMLAERSGAPRLQRLLGVPSRVRSANAADLDGMRSTAAMAGWSELAVAAGRGRLELVQALVAAGADPREVDDSGRTPLYRAVAAGHADVAAWLLEQGAPAIAGGELSLLHLIAAQGPVELLGMLASRGEDLDQVDADGRTAMLAAATRGHAAAVAALLELGASPGAAGPDGRTVLHEVAARGHVELGVRLLRAGAALDVRDGAGRSPLWLAARAGHVPMAELLLDRGARLDPAADGVSPLHVAAELDDSRLLRLLLARAPVDVDVRSQAGTTPLLVAADRGRLDAVRLLVEAGADVNARNAIADTALICAVRNGHRQVSELLLDAGANPGQRNDRRESARALAEGRHDPQWDELFAAHDGVLGLLR